MVEDAKQDKQTTVYSRIRRLILFQIKLAADALRDLLLSPLAIICTLFDIVCHLDGRNSTFEWLMRLGRKSEYFINLFEQKHRFKDQRDIEKVASSLESAIKNEMQSKTLTTKTKQKFRKQSNKIQS